VLKRKDSMYRCGRSPDWLKSKNPAAPAVKREAEEDWEKSGERAKRDQVQVVGGRELLAHYHCSRH